jgi:transcriptional regulator with XRE-family HTH domain
MKNHFFINQISKKLGSVKKVPEWLATYPDFKDQIKLIRETLGMSQEQLARLISCSSRYIQFIESGRAIPRISTLKKIANVLNAELKITIIPRQNLVEFLDAKATQKAGQIVGLSKASSALEIQTPSDEESKEQIETLKKEILEKRRSSLWES